MNQLVFPDQQLLELFARFAAAFPLQPIDFPLQRGTLVVENAGIRTTKYSIAVGRQPPKQIYVRHAKSYGYELRDLPAGTLDQSTGVLIPIPITEGMTSQFSVEDGSVKGGPAPRSLAAKSVKVEGDKVMLA